MVGWDGGPGGVESYSCLVFRLWDGGPGVSNPTVFWYLDCGMVVLGCRILHFFVFRLWDGGPGVSNPEFYAVVAGSTFQ